MTTTRRCHKVRRFQNVSNEQNDPNDSNDPNESNESNDPNDPNDLTKLGKCDVEDAGLPRRVLPLHEDRALIRPFDDADAAVLAFGDEQIH